MRGQQGLTRRVRRILRYYYLRLVRIDDSPEKVARGVALGIFLGVFPTFGLGLILAVVLASRMHANKAAALIGSVVMNPLTSPLFWGLSAWVGANLIGVSEREIAALAAGVEAWVKGWVASTFGQGPDPAAGGVASPWGALFGRLGLAYLAGNVIVSAVAAVAGYYPVVRLARVVHARRLERRHRRALRRAEAAAEKARVAPAPRADLRPGH